MKVYVLVHVLGDETIAGEDQIIPFERVVGVYSTMEGARQAAKEVVSEIFADWPENAREKVIPLDENGEYSPRYTVLSTEEEPEIAGLDVPVRTMTLEEIRLEQYAKFFENRRYELHIGVLEKEGHHLYIFSSELQ